MNSEIIGKTTDMPWAFIFHTQEALVNGELVPRHPTQLYEALAQIPAHEDDISYRCWGWFLFRVLHYDNIYLSFLC